MGIRIHKAIGWGLTAQQMWDLNGWGATDPDQLVEELSDLLDSITELKFPAMFVKEVLPDWRGFVFQRNLLSINFNMKDDNIEDHLPNAGGLMDTVFSNDEITHYLFWPNDAYAKSLKRHDDTIDYQEAVYDSSGKYLDTPMEDLIYEMPQNPYPWNDQLMDPLSGVQHLKEYHGQSDQSNLVPQCLPEIRWWLTEHRIIKPDAWRHIRPYYARYWS